MMIDEFTWFLLILGFLQMMEAHEPIMCRGRVKASSAVVSRSYVLSNQDFSNVSVYLYTDSGHPKGPEIPLVSTGVFFVPIYEPGNFVLKVVGPKGWNFEPKQLDFTITSGAGPKGCQELHFEFTGFSLSGYVVGSRLPSCKQPGTGPPGIDIAMKNDNGETRNEKTDDEGNFAFNNVFPGSFSLSASSSAFSIRESDSTRKMIMKEENTALEEPFQVGGTSLVGKVVRSSGVGLQNVEISITTKDKHVLPCGESTCSLKTDENGKFEIEKMACGEYELTASFLVDKTEYKFKPASKTVSIGYTSHSDVSFTLAGRSSFGVVEDIYGEPVENAAVFLNGDQIAVTDSQGQYTVALLEEGVHYSLTTTLAQNKYLTLTNLDSTSQLPTLTAQEVEFCGVVDPNKEGVNKSGREVRCEGPVRKSALTDQTGRYCFMLPKGAYKLNPVVSGAEARNGIVLSPPHRQLEVGNADKRVQNIDFFQASVTVGGQINCLGECAPDIKVEFSCENCYKKAPREMLATGGSFTFKDVTPGTYKIKVTKDAYCWKQQEMEVEVNFEDMVSLEFEQSGFVINIFVSHDISLDILRETTENVKNLQKTLELTRGHHEQCIDEIGMYFLEPKSCYKFIENEYRFDTSNPKDVHLKASKFLVVGDIRVSPSGSTLKKTDILELTIDSSGGSGRDTIIKAKFVKELENGDHQYQYSFWGVQSEHYTFQPKSEVDSSLLFYPQSHSVSISGQGCPPTVAEFQCRVGKFLSGEITPPIAGVKIVVQDSTGKVTEDMMTNEDGKYSIGPLFDNLQYNVTASNEGYEITRSETNENDFNALKLGVIKVTVIDQHMKPLPEVIVTLVNGDATFLKHLPTLKNGIRTFKGLFPGKYFVRTTLKEYTFKEKGKMTEVVVSEGNDVELSYEAHRNAYSVFGKLQTLSGKPCSDVVVEAIPLSKGAHHEDTRSSADGKYRLRGLQPNFSYEIRIRSSKSDSVDRASPEGVKIEVQPEDTKDVDFIIFEPLKAFSLSGFVTTDSKEVLEIQLGKTSNEKKVLKKIKLKPTFRFFDFSSLPKNKPGEKYIVKVVGPSGVASEPARVSLTKHSYVPLAFEAKRVREQNEFSHSSYVNFFIWLFMLLSLMNYGVMIPLMTGKFSDGVGWLFKKIIKGDDNLRERGNQQRQPNYHRSKKNKGRKKGRGR